MTSPSAASSRAARHLPPLSTVVVAAVVLGGAIGVLLRALLTEAWPVPADAWPWPTFLANLTGAALLGALAWHAQHRPGLHGLLGTGLCGGLTTFSTMQLELLRLIDAGAGGLAVGYATVSVVLGVLAALAAASLATPRSQAR